MIWLGGWRRRWGAKGKGKEGVEELISERGRGDGDRRMMIRNRLSTEVNDSKRVALLNE